MIVLFYNPQILTAAAVRLSFTCGTVLQEHYLVTAATKLQRYYEGGMEFRSPKLSSLLEPTGWFCTRLATLQPTLVQHRFELCRRIYVKIFPINTVNVFSLLMIILITFL